MAPSDFSSASRPCLEFADALYGSNMSDEPLPPLSALQRLSLQRKSQGPSSQLLEKQQKKFNVPSPVNINYKHLENETKMSLDEDPRGHKRSADSSLSRVNQDLASSSVDTARPSKLAALAYTKGSKTQSSSSTTSTRQESKTESNDSSKPMSKLQQRMQANKKAMQERQLGVRSKEDQERAEEEAERRKNAALLPSGDSIHTLFPLRQGSSDIESHGSQQRHSKLGSLANSSCAYVKHPDVPGGSPFVAANHSDVFDQPSPDDIVLNARQGTKLGAS